MLVVKHHGYKSPTVEVGECRGRFEYRVEGIDGERRDVRETRYLHTAS